MDTKKQTDRQNNKLRQTLERSTERQIDRTPRVTIADIIRQKEMERSKCRLIGRITTSLT